MNILAELVYISALLIFLWCYWSLLELKFTIDYNPETMGWRDLLLILSGLVVVPVFILIMLSFFS